jgi:predicted peptidase
MANYFLPWLSNQDFSICQYLKIDDLKFELFIDQMQYEYDLYIQEAFKLYSTFINSDYKIISYSDESYNKLIKKFISKTKFPELYIHKCEINNKEIYQINKQPIWIYNDLNKKIMPLSQCSMLVKKICGITKLMKVIVVNKIK